MEYKNIWLVGCLKINRWERNRVTSVHVDKLQAAFEACRGDAISIGANSLIINTVWDHSIGGEPVQRRKLAIPWATIYQIIQVISWSLSRMRMKNTWEAKRQRNRQSITIFCRVKKKFGRTDEPSGSDDVASGCEFFKGDFGKHIQKQLRIIASVLS